MMQKERNTVYALHHGDRRLNFLSKEDFCKDAISFDRLKIRFRNEQEISD